MCISRKNPELERKVGLLCVSVGLAITVFFHASSPAAANVRDALEGFLLGLGFTALTFFVVHRRQARGRIAGEK